MAARWTPWSKAEMEAWAAPPLEVQEWVGQERVPGSGGRVFVSAGTGSGGDGGGGVPPGQGGSAGSDNIGVVGGRSNGGVVFADGQNGATCVPVTVTTTSLADGTVDQAYSASLAASGGDGSYTWSISAGTLPAGLNLVGNTISGTPSAAGTSAFTVQATSDGQSAIKALSITIEAAPVPVTVTTTSLADGTVDQAYGATLAVGNTISGTPSAAGTSAFTVQATSDGQSATKALSITIEAAAVPVTVTTTSLVDGTVGEAYSATLAASGGNGSYTWSISAGTLPAGLNLVGNTISGTPSAAGTSAFTVQATSDGQSATKALSITIEAAAVPVTVTTTSLVDGTVGEAYSASLAASGGDGSYTWSISVGTLPAGLSLVGNTISGTPSAAGTSAFTVQATSDGQSATKALSITIEAAAVPVTVTTTSLVDGTVDQAYNATLV